MSDGNWRKHLTLGLAGALASIWIGGAVLTALPVFEYDPAKYETQEERQEARADYDTRSQVWMAWAAWAQVVVGGVGLFGLGITVYFTRHAWLEAREAARQAKRSADLAEDELHEANRGKLFVSVPQDTIEFTGTDDSIPVINFVVQNVGARHLVLRTAGMALTLHPPFAKDRPSFPDRLSSSATTVHPILLRAGEQSEIDGTIYGVGRPGDRWISADNWPGLDGTPYFFGSILYTDHLDTWRRYEFCFQCYSPNDEWGGMIQFEWASDEPIYREPRRRK